MEGEPPKLRAKGWVGFDRQKKVFNAERKQHKPVHGGKLVWDPGKQLISQQPPGVTLLCSMAAPRMAPESHPPPPNILPIEKAVPGTIRWVLYEAWGDGRTVGFEDRTIQA